jgi:hypothetical protein
MGGRRCAGLRIHAHVQDSSFEIRNDHLNVVCIDSDTTCWLQELERQEEVRARLQEEQQQQRQREQTERERQEAKEAKQQAKQAKQQAKQQATQQKPGVGFDGEFDGGEPGPNKSQQGLLDTHSSQYAASPPAYIAPGPVVFCDCYLLVSPTGGRSYHRSFRSTGSRRSRGSQPADVGAGVFEGPTEQRGGLQGARGAADPRADLAGVSLYDSTFSRTVWRLCGGAKGLVVWYRPGRWRAERCAERGGELRRRGEATPPASVVRHTSAVYVACTYSATQ